MTNKQSYNTTGLFMLSIRLVVGWTYFSAFWRRLVLENKLDPEAAGYIGEKFNHFLPNALGIQSMIEYLVTHEAVLWWFMVAFTIIEGIAGLLFMLGLYTRLMSAIVFGLAMGILLGAGWLGTTCLDEWQIGILGIAAGFSIFLSGSGKHSLDYVLAKNKPKLSAKKWFLWMTSGELPLKDKMLQKIAVIGAIAIFGLTLYTNQYFHGGVWGTLHNKSVKPLVTINDAKIENGKLSFEVNRVEGADVYGSFLIGVTIKDASGTVIVNHDGKQLSMIAPSMIKNKYVAKVKPGKHSLIIPLGAKAMLTFQDDELKNIGKGQYHLELTDISGIVWKSTIVL